MSTVTRTRVAAALGLFSIILSAVGLSIHGYPAIGASGEEIARWAASTNQQQFGVGVYIEALGTLLFLPFAAWLWSVARDAEGGLGWLATTGFGAVVLFSGISVMDNGIWSSLLDGARHGTSPQALASIRDIAEYIFHATLLFGGMFFVLTGYVLFRTRVLPRWVGASAVVIGLGLLVPPLAIFAALLVWVWTVVVSLYLLVRPRAVAAVREPSGAMAVPAAAGTRS
ncbi:MAG TPA: DUF4386 family protein [Rubrobacteraceae bacterium]|nr:DUF4386 family protein [Rubrobacteraceae bacterium]